MKDTTFVLMRGSKPSVEPELQKRINESVQGLERKIAVGKALEILATAGQKALCGIPVAENPNECVIFLE